MNGENILSNFKKNNLWVFGDSFSMPFDMAMHNTFFKKYLNKLNIEKIDMWGDMLSSKLNLDLINTAVGGSDNYTIFQKFCENCHNIKENDVVIINWSRIERFRISLSDKPNFRTVLPMKTHESFYKDIIFTETDLNKILIDRDNYIFQNEINMWASFINEFCKLKNVKILFWGICEHQPYFFLHYGKEFVKKQGGWKILHDFPELDDHHFSINGHILFTNSAESYIQNYRYNSIEMFLNTQYKRNPKLS